MIYAMACIEIAVNESDKLKETFQELEESWGKPASL